MKQLAQIIGSENMSTRLIDRLAYARDASLYRLVPQAIVRPHNTDHVRDIMAWCVANQQHLTFRAAGTSLSGQAVTDGILVDLSRHWQSVRVLEEGARVRVQPGVTGGRVNGLLRPHGRKLGPDPASMTACMIGGIVANNASGMCCGTALNSYHTVDSIKFMLADGTRIDTASEACNEALLRDNKNVYNGIAALRDDIRSNSELCARIRHKYRIKNTIGYSLNAFLDEDQPARILARLMIGSEGTLGFIEEVTFRTVPDARHKLTTLLVFASIEAACSQVEPLRVAGASAVEIMDDASLASFAVLPTTPELYRILEPGAAALLVEFHAASLEETETQFEWATAWSAGIQTLREVVWTRNPQEQAQLWHLRKGLMPTLGAMRPPGSTMINEDVAVPAHLLSQLVHDVRATCIRHGYNDAIIFGHAKDGNIHFVLNQMFTGSADIHRYGVFMDDIAAVVVQKHNGSLKAEHGTGRNMAPYVEMEWGSEAYRIMQTLKKIVDPHGILNPDVILSNNPSIHVENIKPVPEVNAIVDRCIECGFCEHVCPSRNITLTPRQRIVVLRELHGHLTHRERSEVLRDYQYESIDTCAADGMCELACPVSINTGTFVKHIRSEKSSYFARKAAKLAASNYGITNTFMRVATPMLVRMKTAGKGLRRTPSERLHQTEPAISQDASFAKRSSSSAEASAANAFVLMSACGSRWLDPNENLLFVLASRAGLNVRMAAHSGSLCCGQIFESRGLIQASQTVAQSTLMSVDFRDATIVVDSTTCAHALALNASSDQLVMDSITFIDQYVLPHLSVTRPLNHVVLHPGCGAHHLGVVDVMRRIAEQCATSVTIPISAGCCGMAGDRGLRYPELLASAQRDEESELAALIDVDGWFGANTTCELGLRMRTGKTWRSLSALVYEATS